MPDAPPLHRAHANRAPWTKQPGADQRTLTGRPWRRLRARVMQRDRFLCQICQRAGRVTVATECDHIRPVAECVGTDANAMSNLQSLCHRCHSIKTAQEGTGAQYAPAWLPMPACPVVLVTGPPGAGKTTYAHERATVDDCIIDLDDCFTDVCGVHGHTADRVHLSAALRWRNRQLADLAGRRTGRAYFIVSAPTAREVDWWRARLNAVHVKLDPGMAVAMARTEPSRQPTVTRWYESQRANDWTPS